MRKVYKNPISCSTDLEAEKLIIRQGLKDLNSHQKSIQEAYELKHSCTASKVENYLSGKDWWTQIEIFTMVSFFLRWTLLKFFSSFPDEQSQQKVPHLDRITCVVINTSNEVMCLLLWEFWIYNFSRRILEKVFVGSIVNIRNECLFIWIHGEWIVARNKQITREPLRGSRDLFVPRYDSYPMNPEKKTLIP